MKNLANDNEAPTRLTELVSVTIEDFLVYAEKDFDEGEEPIQIGPALVELAAVAMAKAILEEDVMPEVAMQLARNRAITILCDAVDRIDALRRPHISIVHSAGDR